MGWDGIGSPFWQHIISPVQPHYLEVTYFMSFKDWPGFTPRRWKTIALTPDIKLFYALLILLSVVYIYSINNCLV